MPCKSEHIPTVAVCIPTCNQAQYLEVAVESALAQSYPVSEVWIANDRSDDNTQNVIVEMHAKSSKVKWILNSVRLGISENVNVILRKPKTDYIVRLDSDDRLSVDYVKEMVQLFDKYPNAGIFHCNTTQIDEKGVKVRLRTQARDEEFQSGETTLRQAAFRYGVTANICAYRRPMLEQLEFTAGRPSYLEDYDLWVRAAGVGWGNVFSSKVLADYRVWKDVKGIRSKRKGTELEGLIRLFNESLTPKFMSRGWPVGILSRARRKHALDHVVYLAEIELSQKESELISQLLIELSADSLLISSLVAIGQSRFRKVLIIVKYLRTSLVRIKRFVCKLRRLGK